MRTPKTLKEMWMMSDAMEKKVRIKAHQCGIDRCKVELDIFSVLFDKFPCRALSQSLAGAVLVTAWGVLPFLLDEFNRVGIPISLRHGDFSVMLLQ
jgi:hypothetical protein